LGLFVRGEVGGSQKYLPQLDLIITNSQGMAEYVKGLLNDKKVPTLVIPNSLDKEFCPQLKLKEKITNRIIYFGRIDKIKGVYELLQAFRLVLNKISSARLEIIGGNFGTGKLTNYEECLKNYVQKHRLNVNFIGKIPNEEIPKLISQADLAVFPSICLESFGMVALEAMRCGLPVVASRRPGFEELIVDGETGFLIDDPKNIMLLSKKILWLLNHPNECIAMGIKGFEKSLNFTPDQTSIEFEKEITKFINE
jgi:glycosyltransferase involved in cell wall biosynthesis